MNAQSGWTKPKGQGYFKLSEWWIVADQHFTDAGEVDPNVTTGLYNTTLYADYGITDRIQAELNFPLFSRTVTNNLVSGSTGEVLVPGEALNGIGDADVGLRYGITKNRRIALSAGITLGLPLGNPSGGSEGTLQTGDGEFNQIVNIAAGTSLSFGDLPAYAQMSVGYNNRTNGFSDEFRANFEIGIQPVPNKLWIIARINNLESMRNGDKSEQDAGMSLFANNTEYTGVSFEVAYYLNDRWGISGMAAGATRAELIFAAPSYSLGVYFDMK